jgi:uncharacterized membrane protein
MIAFHEVINAISFVLNIVGALVILFGVLIAMIDFLKKEVFGGDERIKLNESIRIRMGSYLVLGLEFFIAGDIVRTIITPTWESIGMLGAIVIIRTILSYFLTKDLRGVVK